MIPISLWKTQFGSEVRLLGGIRTLEGFKPDPKRVQALDDLPEPTTRKELMSQMFLLRFFADHSPNLQLELGPLNALTSNKSPFRWGEAERTVWKKALMAVKQQVLLEPFNWARKTVLITDASQQGRGFWLLQLDDESKMHIVMLKSKAWKKGQHAWSAIRKECTAVIEALHDSERYVRFCNFTLLTDHRPLLWLLRQVQLAPTMWGGAALRAVLYFSQFQCDFRHVAGRNNQIADLLSRYPFCRDVVQDGDKSAPKWFTDALIAAGQAPEFSDTRSINALGRGRKAESGEPKAKQGVRTWKERSNLLQRLQHEQPPHVLELCKELGLFVANPDCPQDVFQLLAIARLSDQPIPDVLRERFESILEEVERFLPELSFSEG